MVGSILQSTSSSACSLLKLPFHLEDLEVSPAAQARSQVHCLGQHRGKTQTANDGWWVQNVDVQLVQPEKWDEMRSRSPTTPIRRIWKILGAEDYRRLWEPYGAMEMCCWLVSQKVSLVVSSIYAQPYFDMLRCWPVISLSKMKSFWAGIGRGQRYHLKFLQTNQVICYKSGWPTWSLG